MDLTEEKAKHTRQKSSTFAGLGLGTIDPPGPSSWLASSDGRGGNSKGSRQRLDDTSQQDVDWHASEEEEEEEEMLRDEGNYELRVGAAEERGDDEAADVEEEEEEDRAEVIWRKGPFLRRYGDLRSGVDDSEGSGSEEEFRDDRDEMESYSEDHYPDRGEDRGDNAWVDQDQGVSDHTTHSLVGDDSYLAPLTSNTGHDSRVTSPPSEYSDGESRLREPSTASTATLRRTTSSFHVHPTSLSRGVRETMTVEPSVSGSAIAGPVTKGADEKISPMLDVQEVGDEPMVREGDSHETPSSVSLLNVDY